MTCRTYREDIGLLAGRDLTDPVRVADARRHLASCPDCRQKYGRMRDGLSVLAAANGPSTWTAPPADVWPSVKSRLAAGPPAAEPRWMPTLAMAAVCVAAATAFLTLGGGEPAVVATPSDEVEAFQPSATRSMPASRGRLSNGFGRLAE